MYLSKTHFDVQQRLVLRLRLFGLNLLIMLLIRRCGAFQPRARLEVGAINHILP